MANSLVNLSADPDPSGVEGGVPGVLGSPQIVPHLPKGTRCGAGKGEGWWKVGW